MKRKRATLHWSVQALLYQALMKVAIATHGDNLHQALTESKKGAVIG